MFRFGNRSERNLVGVHPDLVRVLRRAIEITPVDFSIIEGVRTLKRQAELYQQGRTTPGKIVTNTMKSNHLPKADGYGHAVDLIPVNLPTGWPIENFKPVLRAIRKASIELNIPVKFGINWSTDPDSVTGKTPIDAPHVELY